MDFAVAAAFRAINKFSPVLSRMGVDMGKFGSMAEGAMAKASKGANIFKAVLGANLMTGVIRRVSREIMSIPRTLEAFAARGQEIGRTAGMIGVTAEAFQRLSYAAKLTDTPVDVLTRGMGLLNRSMGQLQAGTGPLNSMLRKLDPSLARQLRTVQDSKEAFLVLGDAISRTKDVQTRAAIAQAAFGKGGMELIPMLAQGRAGLHKLMQEADKFGSVLDDRAVAAAGRLDDTLKRLRGGLQSIKDRVLSLVLRGITPFVEKAAAWVAANKELISSKIESFISGVGRALERAGPFLEKITKGFEWIVTHKAETLAAFFLLKAAAIGLSAALSANPIGAVVASLYLLAAAVVIVVKYWDQITEALRRSWNWFNKMFENPWIKVALYALAAPLALIASFIQTIVDLLSGKGWKSFANLLGPYKMITDAIGLTKKGAGQWNAPAEAPNQAAAAGQTPSLRFVNQVNVDNSRAPGVESRVRFNPVLAGNPGLNP